MTNDELEYLKQERDLFARQIARLRVAGQEPPRGLLDSFREHDMLVTLAEAGELDDETRDTLPDAAAAP